MLGFVVELSAIDSIDGWIVIVLNDGNILDVGIVDDDGNIDGFKDKEGTFE